MNTDEAKKLREPFPASAVGKLPKPTKKENPKGKCSECGGWHGLPAVHLDYVGHAATTDRLLSVDPQWTWEPMAYGPNGEPLMTNGGMWIWLTVCGVKKPGFGDGASPKEVIGDAIRNAAMRFGVALDLWAKEDLNGSEGEPKPAAAAGSAKPKTEKPSAPAASSSPSEADQLATRLIDVAEKLGAHDATVEAVARHRTSDSPEAFVVWLKRQLVTAEKNLEQKAAA